MPFNDVYWAVDHLLALCSLIRLPIDYSGKFGWKLEKIESFAAVYLFRVHLNLYIG